MPFVKRMRKGLNTYLIHPIHLKAKTHTQNQIKMSASKDTIVQAIVEKFLSRSSLGIEKYGTTLDREDLNTIEWINHAQEELMDAILYLERLKKEFSRSAPIPPQTPPNTPPTVSILSTIFQRSNNQDETLLPRPMRKAQRKLMNANDVDQEDDIITLANNGLL